jgi:hypothetical protein
MPDEISILNKIAPGKLMAKATNASIATTMPMYFAVRRALLPGFDSV